MRVWMNKKKRKKKKSEEKVGQGKDDGYLERGTMKALTGFEIHLIFHFIDHNQCFFILR